MTRKYAPEIIAFLLSFVVGCLAFGHETYLFAREVSATTQPVRDIAQARAGQVVTVAAGTYDLLGLSVPNGVTVRADDGATVVFRAMGNPNQQILRLRSDNATVDGITFAPIGCVAVDVAACSGVTLRNLTIAADYTIPATTDDGRKVMAPVSGYHGVKLDGVSNLLIDGLVIPRQMSHYGLTIMGRQSRGVTVRNYSHHGSVHEHGLRCTSVDGLCIVNMRGLVDYADPGTKNVGALSIRNDGRNITVIDSELRGLGVGPQNTDPPTSTTENVTFIRCALFLNVTHYGGNRLKNVRYLGCSRNGQPFPGVN